MTLTISKNLPSITFNGRKVFAGKTAFIRSIKALNLPFRHYSFEGDSFDAVKATELLLTSLKSEV